MMLILSAAKSLSLFCLKFYMLFFFALSLDVLLLQGLILILQGLVWASL